MAKSNNLFTADDFSKDGGKKFPWWIIIALVVIAIIVCLFLFLKKDKPIEQPTNPEPAQIEQVDDIPDVTPTSEEATTITPTNEAPNTQKEPAPVVETPKVEQQKPATTSQYSGNLSILNGKTLKEKANVVISGYFGNNPDRKRALGDAYKEIQEKVNEMYRNGEVR